MLLLKLSVLESVIVTNMKDIHKYNTQVSPIKGRNIKERKSHKAAQTKAPESPDTGVLLSTSSPITRALHWTLQ